MAAPHPWRFARLGGFDQVRLETAQDYARLGDLDRKLWAALACPVKGLEFDERTLALVDTDGDGRVRAPEVVAAVEWAGKRLADLGALREGSDVLPLARISDGALLESARSILAGRGKGGATAIALEDLAEGPGPAEAPATLAWKAVKGKVDDFFARCRLAAFDSRALATLNRGEADYAAVVGTDLSPDAAEIASFPVARIEAGRALPLVEGINPAWAGRIAAFREAAVEPAHGKGKDSLAEAEWLELSTSLAAREAGRVAKPVPASGDLERLIRYHRDLHRLLVNFVNLSDFYGRSRPAIFQAGTLYLDGRACDLCVRVDDPGRHAALAGYSKAYLAYCECTRPSGERMTVAAAFTGGDSDFLMVGRNGVFFDRRGRDWDATITKVVENPISLRQAFWFPYKKMVRTIEEFVAKRAAAAEGQEVVPQGAKKIDVGTVAALGVAFGAIGTLLVTIAGYATGLLKLPFWQICLVIGGLLLLVSLPSMVIAWLKLRQRNLAPILDANGWAVNGRVKLSMRFGRSLTSVAELPPGALPGSDDPFADRPSPWPKVILGILLACFVYSVFNSQGLVNEWSKGRLGDPKPAPEANPGK